MKKKIISILILICITFFTLSITTSATEIDSMERNQTNASPTITLTKTRHYYSSNTNENSIFVFPIMLGLVALFYFLKYKYEQSKDDNAGERMLQEKIKQSSNNNIDTYGEPQNFTEQIAGEIRKKDGNFSGDKFIWLAENYFIAYKDAYSNRDIKLLDELTTEDIFFNDKNTIEEQIENGTAHICQRIKFETDYLFRYEYNDKFEYVTLYIKAKMIDYMQNIATGDSFYGSKTKDIFGFYIMTLRRKIGDKTIIFDEVKSCLCPNCGANMDAVVAGRCKFCGQSSKVTDSTWKISAICQTNLGPELGRTGIFRIS